MASQPVQAEAKATGATAPMFPCIRLILLSLQRSGKGWRIHPAKLEQALSLFCKSLRGPEAAATIEQFFAMLGAIEHNLKAPGMVQRLLDAAEEQVSQADMDAFQEQVGRALSLKTELAARKFKQMMGGGQQGTAVPEPEKKIAFTLPRTFRG